MLPEHSQLALHGARYYISSEHVEVAPVSEEVFYFSRSL